MTEFLPKVPRVVHFVIAAPCVIKVIYSMQHIVLINARGKKSLFQVFFYVKLGWFFYISIVCIKVNDIFSARKMPVLLDSQLWSGAHYIPTLLPSPYSVTRLQCQATDTITDSFDWEESLIESFMYPKLINCFVILC